MKIERFNEAKRIKDQNIGLFSEKVEVNVLFRVSKSVVDEDIEEDEHKYSLRAGIEGFNTGVNGPTILIGQYLTIEEVENEKMKYLSNISALHRNAKKYNL